MAALTIDGLTKAFGSHPVLSGVGLHVSVGTLVTLLGTSGSGKTTLLRLVCGFERADAGTIRLDDRIVSGPGIHLPPERRRIGYVAQDGALFPHLSVGANIAFGLPRRDRHAFGTIERLLESVGLRLSYAGRFPHELSGGEQQRVALARALAPEPRIVLLDEPFSSLDAALRVETRQAVADTIAATGATALLVTHDQSEALSMGRQVAVLRRGVMVQIDTPEGLYRRPVDAELARFIGEAVVLQGEADGERVDCGLGCLRLAAGMPHGAVDVMVRPEQIRLVDESVPGSVAAEVRGVTFYGHDATVTLKLGDASGSSIIARVSGHARPRAGDTVRLSVDSEVVCYPRT